MLGTKTEMPQLTKAFLQQVYTTLMASYDIAAENNVDDNRANMIVNMLAKTEQYLNAIRQDP